eukprot:Nk52_evm1s2097 gene=Nk52_evmTU1s2097
MHSLCLNEYFHTNRIPAWTSSIITERQISKCNLLVEYVSQNNISCAVLPSLLSNSAGKSKSIEFLIARFNDRDVVYVGSDRSCSAESRYKFVIDFFNYKFAKGSQQWRFSAAQVPDAPKEFTSEEILRKLESRVFFDVHNIDLTGCNTQLCILHVVKNGFTSRWLGTYDHRQVEKFWQSLPDLLLYTVAHEDVFLPKGKH